MQSHNIWIEINSDKLLDNVKALSGYLGSETKIMAIIKANAYGHGISKVADLLSDKVSFFGVATYQEGKALRSQGIDLPILILGPLLPSDFQDAIELDLSLTASDSEYVESINAVAAKLNRKAKLHLKIDTGMGRWGFVYKSAYQEIKNFINSENIIFEGLFTHFPVADDLRSDYTERQLELFQLLIDELDKKNISFKYIHSANSAGVLNYEESHFNLVRPGLMLYGYLPDKQVHDDIVLAPTLSLKSRVSLIKKFAAARGVSYGRNYITPSQTRIAVVPVGYSHGYPYALSAKADVLINGKRFPIAGNVCMDYLMVDLHQDETINIGDEVVLLGSSGAELISAQELADKAGTISYEILTGLNCCIPREYV